MRDMETLRCEHGFRKPCTVCDPYVCSKLDPRNTSTPGQWEMPPEEDAIVFVIAPNHQWFETWCRVDNTPPLNPNDRRWRVLASADDAIRLVRGRHKREHDDVLWLGAPDWRSGGLLEIIQYALIPQGFTTCVTPDGHRMPL